MRCECAAVGGATAPAEPVHLDVVGDAHCGGGIGVKGDGRGGFLFLTVVVMKSTGKLTLSAITPGRPSQWIAQLIGVVGYLGSQKARGWPENLMDEVSVSWCHQVGNAQVGVLGCSSVQPVIKMARVESRWR